MKAFSELLILSLSLLWLRNEHTFVQAHFIFTKLVPEGQDGQSAHVFFSEPVAMGGKGINFLGGRVQQLSLIGKDSGVQTLSLSLSDQSEYMAGALPPSLSSPDGPLLVTGFLDYGDFGEGGAPKKDLQYTFSAQTFSTNPAEDWKNFFHNFKDMDGYTEAFPDEQPFAIALRNYGPPYEVVVRGVSDTTIIDVCLYEGNGSNRKVGCVQGTTEGKNHLMIDSISDTEILNPCETYVALANTTGTDEETGKEKRLWSSTSVTWNGPCARSAHTQALATSVTLSNSTQQQFLAGLLVSLTIFTLMNLARNKLKSVKYYNFYYMSEENGSYSDTNNEEEPKTMEMA